MSFQLGLFGDEPKVYPQNIRPYARLDPKGAFQFSDVECIVQHVKTCHHWSQGLKTEFVLHPTLNKHLRTCSEALLKKCLREEDVPRSADKYLLRYSKFLCRAHSSHGGISGRSANIWRKRYNQFLRNWIAFGKPRAETCTEVQIRVVNTYDVTTGDVRLLFVPSLYALIQLNHDFGVWTQTTFGFRDENKERVLRKVKETCVKRTQNLALLEG